MEDKKTRTLEEKVRKYRIGIVNLLPHEINDEIVRREVDKELENVEVVSWSVEGVIHHKDILQSPCNYTSIILQYRELGRKV